MKRLLVLAYFFPPLGGGGCQRTLKLVRYLEPQGWAATVVTAADSDYWILDLTLLEEVPASTRIIRVRGLTSLRLLRLLSSAGVPIEQPQGGRNPGVVRKLRRLQSWLLIPDGYRSWSQAAARLAAKQIELRNVDALWTTSSPESAHVAGLALKRRFGIPWIADFRDPWVGRATYHPPTSWHDARHRALERAVVEAADRITVVSEAMASLYRERYPGIAGDRIVTLPNGVDSDDWRRAESVAADAAGEADRDRFVLLHAGQLAHRPTVRTLLGAARRVINADPAALAQLRLRFLGGNEELVRREWDAMGLGENVEMLPSRPHLEALAAMRRAQALVLLGHGGGADALLYTGKIYEYLTSGRPVLGILDHGPAAELIHDSGSGSVCSSGDAACAAEVIGRWIAAWRRGESLGVRPPAPLAASWERRNIAARAADLLTNLVR